LRGQDAQDFLQGMLGRNPDLFGMQGQQDARTMEEILAARPGHAPTPGGNKRRGMLNAGQFWQNDLNQMSPDELQQLMQSAGGDDWYDTLKKMGPGLFDLGSSIYNRSALSGDAAQRLQQAQAPLYTPFVGAAQNQLSQAGSMNPQVLAQQRFGQQQALVNPVQ